MFYKTNNNYQLLSQDNSVYFVQNTVNKQIYIINPIGWFILNNIDGRSKNDIVKMLSEKIIDTDIGEDKILNDVNVYIDNLICQGFIGENE